MLIAQIIGKYQDAKVEETVDFNKFNHIAVVHHSTAIEGSELTEIETGILLNEGLTPRGKPLVHSLMIKDHFEALMFVLEKAGGKTEISLDMVQRIAGLVLKSTGSVYETARGRVDASKGEFRKGNVRVGESSFPNHAKVPVLVRDLVAGVQEKMRQNLNTTEQVHLSFDVHFHLVSIHPFYDGNGRTSRLLMNYIQHYYGLPLAIVHKESRADYFQAIVDARSKNDPAIFRLFMENEYARQLLGEIGKSEG